jgi:transposase
MDVSSDASSFERPRRIEILTGVERRRRWGSETKARIVAESLAPGAVVAEIARRYDIRASQIQLWRRQARNGLDSASAAQEPAFAPVVVTPTVGRSKPQSESAAQLEIEAGAVRVVVRSGADIALVETVLRVLKERA